MRTAPRRPLNFPRTSQPLKGEQPMNTNTATEYRNLPLAVLTESATNPAAFLKIPPQGIGREYPHPGSALSLACAASQRSEL